MKLMVITILLGLASFLQADDDFKFEAIGEKDWAITEDPAKDIRDAVIIFEKIAVDDEKLVDKKCYYTIYRRIRILNHKGRSEGDVTVPFLHREQKVEEIKGRTILPDGREFHLDKSKILEKEVFKYQDFKVRQKYFHMPRVADDCIVEYYIKIKLKYPRNFWLIERDIFLKNGQLIWKFYKGRGLSQKNYSTIEDIVTPNYVWFNNKQKLHVEFSPSLKEPEEVHFTIKNVTPFDNEVYSLPDLALKANLRYYYGDNAASDVFWGKQSDDRVESYEEFTRKNSKIDNIINDFKLLEFDDEKIIAAYQWIQDNIKKTSYEDDEEFDENDNIKDVLKHVYGSATDIDLLFFDMLREMNIDAKMAYIVDRDESLLEKNAKYWQFDRSIVTIQDTENGYTFYDPSPKYLLPGSLLWYNEGVDAFIIDSQFESFHGTIFSNYKQNHIARILKLKMKSDLSCWGYVADKQKGHPARSLRLDLDETTELDQRSQLKDYYKDVFPYGQIDSISVENLKDPTESLIIKSKIELPYIGQYAHDRIILKVSDLLGYQQNEFVDDERKYPIIFKYTHEVLDLVDLEIPENYEIEEIPEDQLISNLTGACQIQVKGLNRGRVVSISRLFRLAMPFFRPDDYPGVRYLFQMRDYFNDAAIILKKKPEKPIIKS